jgi:hypothetical protein
MREERTNGIESQCRKRLPKDSLRIFNEMKVYSEEVSPNKARLMKGANILCPGENLSRQQEQGAS